MRAAVIDLLQPGPQARVEIVEAQDLAFIDLAEKLIAAGAVPALELPLHMSSQLQMKQSISNEFFGSPTPSTPSSDASSL
jgi:hypothetical protein